MGDEGILAVCDEISNLKSIKSAQINLFNNSLSIETMEIIFEQFGKLHNLENF